MTSFIVFLIILLWVLIGAISTIIYLGVENRYNKYIPLEADFIIISSALGPLAGIYIIFLIAEKLRKPKIKNPFYKQTDDE